MRKEHAHFDKEKMALVVSGKKEDPIWYCTGEYKLFKDGVHQEKIWWRSMDDNIDYTEYGPLTKAQFESIWMLDGADCYCLSEAYEEEGWSYGFYYGINMRPTHQHSLFCWAKGLGKDRQYIIRSIKVIEQD